MTAKPDRCGCGRMPGLRSRARGGPPGDALSIETWVQCPGCGRAGAATVNVARDDSAAVANWNAGKGRVW